MHAVAAAYPQSTLNGTPTDSNLNGTASYETHLAGQEESGCVERMCRLTAFIHDILCFVFVFHRGFIV